jgi:hypothetical protein
MTQQQMPHPGVSVLGNPRVIFYCAPFYGLRSMRIF